MSVRRFHPPLRPPARASGPDPKAQRRDQQAHGCDLALMQDQMQEGGGEHENEMMRHRRETRPIGMHQSHDHHFASEGHRYPHELSLLVLVWVRLCGEPR